jgi:hypothetical protein
MKAAPVYLLLLALGAGPLAASTLEYAGQRLDLRAQARACYLGLFSLYDVDYFRETANSDEPTRCVRVSYLRQFSSAALDEATLKVFAQRHGADVADRYREELARIGDVYEAVNPGDRYTYCVAEGGGAALLRDGTPTLRLEYGDFARRFLQIWVSSDDDPASPEWAFGSC